MWAYCGSSQRKELLSEQQKGIGCPNFHLLWCILHGYPKDISRGSILSVKSPLNPNFWTPFPFYSRRDNPFPLTGMGMENCIPKFWEREWEWKFPFPTFGNGNGNKNRIPNIWEWEREWKLPSRLLGTGMRCWYSREWLGTGMGMTFKNPISIRILSQNGEGPNSIHHFVQSDIFYIANIQKLCYRNNVSILVMFFMKKLTAQIANMQNIHLITFIGLKIQEMFGHFGKIPWRTLRMPTLGSIKC